MKKITVIGGYLDGFKVDLSDNLIAIIGGRGTGKSTIVNLIRYTLGLSPVNRERAKDFDEMAAHNLGCSSRIELLLSSNARYGQIFKIIRRFKSEPVIEDENGNVSKLKIHDILPSIEIYGQNEIVDAVRDPELVTGIVKRLFKVDTSLMAHIEEKYQSLQENNKCIKELEDAVDADESEISDLPALKERLRFYQEAGLESKLGLITKTTTQEATFEEFYKQMSTLEMNFPKMSFGTEDEALRKLNTFVTEFNQKTEKLGQQYVELKQWLSEQYNEIKEQWNKSKIEHDDEIKLSLKQVQGIQDKSSDFDVFTFADDVRKGADCLKDKYLLTLSTAEKIVNALHDVDLREIESEILPDLYIIELL